MSVPRSVRAYDEPACRGFLLDRRGPDPRWPLSRRAVRGSWSGSLPNGVQHVRTGDETEKPLTVHNQQPVDLLIGHEPRGLFDRRLRWQGENRTGHRVRHRTVGERIPFGADRLRHAYIHARTGVSHSSR
jgi:hypothetical protein